MVNLARDVWLPVGWRTGEAGRVSARTALARAGELRGLAAEPPTMLPAVLRQVLLPLMLVAMGAPRSRKEWQERFAAGEFDEGQLAQLDAYLEKHGHRFELFDGPHPFAQVAGLEALSGETKPVSLLVPSVATGNNVPLFTPFTEAYGYEMSPEDAALWLLHAHCWDTAAIKTGAKGDPEAKAGKTTGNPTGPLGRLGVVVPEGNTLFETLLLNTPVIWDRRGARFAEDRPQWEADHGPSWRKRPARGLLDVLTWQSRRIRLIPEETGHGRRVRRVVVSAGDRLATPDETAWEPHTLWVHTSKPKKGQAPTRPKRHRPGEFAWQGLASLLALGHEEDGDGPRTSELLRQIAELQAEGHLPDDYLMRTRLCGMVYGTKSAVVEDVLADSLPLPTAALVSGSPVRAAVLEASQQAEQVAHALDSLAADLRRAEGAQPVPWGKGQRPGLTYLHLVDIPMRRLLNGLCRVAEDEAGIEEVMTAWELILARNAWDLADDLLASVPPSTFGGKKVSTPDGKKKETKSKKEEKTYRPADARAHFRRALNKILTRAACGPAAAQGDGWDGPEDEEDED